MRAGADCRPGGAPGGRAPAAGVHRFKVGGRLFLLDVGTGALFRLSRVAWEAVERVAPGPAEGRGWLPGPGGGGVARPAVQGAGAAWRRSPAVLELEGLIEEGRVLSPEAPPPPAGQAAGARPGLRALCLNLAQACNLRCTYCFARLHGAAGGPALMPPEVAERAIDFLVEASGPDPGLEVDFFGGEPLLNLEVLKRAVSHARRRGREAGKHFRFTVTTNGLLLSPEVGRYLDETMHNVVLSLDGRPRVHDAQRRLPDGRGSFRLVFPNVRRFVARRGRRDYWVRGTYTALNRDFSRDALFLARMGFEHISLEPVVALPPGPVRSRQVAAPSMMVPSPARRPPAAAPADPLALGPQDLGRLAAEYDRLARACLLWAKTGRPFEFFHFRLDQRRGPCLARRVGGCGAGRDYLAVAPSGELYPCHQFIGRPQFRLGDVFRGLEAGPTRDCFASLSLYSKRDCPQCWGRFYCGGGCHANAHLLTGDPSTPDRTGCALFLARLERALYLSAELRRPESGAGVGADGRAPGDAPGDAAAPRQEAWATPPAREVRP